MAAEKILAVLNRDDLNSGWLVWLLKSVLRQAPSFDQRAVETALVEIGKRGFLEKKNDEYIPANQLLVLCRRMLIMNMLYRIDAIRLDGDGQAIRQTFGVVQNGCRDILYLEATEATVFLTGLSGKTLMTLLEHYLTNPEAIPAAVTGSVAQSDSSCTKCGKTVEAEAAFCKFCGTPQRPIEEKPRFCSGCGATLKRGKPFCTKCGKAVS